MCPFILLWFSNSYNNIGPEIFCNVNSWPKIFYNINNWLNIVFNVNIWPKIFCNTNKGPSIFCNVISCMEILLCWGSINCWAVRQPMTVWLQCLIDNIHSVQGYDIEQFLSYEYFLIWISLVALNILTYL